MCLSEFGKGRGTGTRKVGVYGREGQGGMNEQGRRNEWQGPLGNEKGRINEWKGERGLEKGTDGGIRPSGSECMNGTWT